MNHQPSTHSDRRQPILVTGAHRTGTTWVGKMLAADPHVAYISEPLNLWHRPGVMLSPVQHWYTYICEENEASYLPSLRQTLAFHYHTWAELKSLRSRKDVLRMSRDLGIFLRGRLKDSRPLLKDPFAVFSAGWFARRLNCRVVITMRHPAAFVSSLKRLGWNFDFGDLLAQPLLMRDWLEPYREQIQAILARPEDVVGQASLLWHMIYSAAASLRESYPDFILVRHEDLSLEPVSGFQELYALLGLEFTPQVIERVLQSSSPENPREISWNAIHAVHLDSRANLQNWRRRMSAEEILRVRTLTADLASLHYPDLDW